MLRTFDSPPTYPKPYYQKQRVEDKENSGFRSGADEEREWIDIQGKEDGNKEMRPRKALQACWPYQR